MHKGHIVKIRLGNMGDDENLYHSYKYQILSPNGIFLVWVSKLAKFQVVHLVKITDLLGACVILHLLRSVCEVEYE